MRNLQERKLGSKFPDYKNTQYGMVCIMPIVIPMTVIVVYAANVYIFAIKVMLIFGFLGFIPMAPLVLGLILGELADKGFRQAIMQRKESIIPLLNRPFGLVLIAVIMIIISMIFSIRKYAKNKSSHHKSSNVSEGLAKGQ